VHDPTQQVTPKVIRPKEMISAEGGVGILDVLPQGVREDADVDEKRGQQRVEHE
jgi:hypothetical protein